MIKAVIFDLDGTLLDTLHDIHAVINDSLSAFSLPQISFENTTKFVGNGAKKLVERAVGKRSDLLESVYAYYSQKFADCENNLTKLFPDEAEVLENLKSYGFSLNVLSNKPQIATERVCAKFLSKFGFSIVLGQTEYYPLKPNPESTLAILNKLQLKKDECVFVGDGETDIQTARAAGIKCVSALWGYRTKEELSAAGAACFAENFKELEHILLSLN